MSNYVATVRARADRALVLRRLPRLVAFLLVAFGLVWVLFWAPKTTYGPATSDPTDFFKTFLDSLTFAGLLFVVASGFTLIFGLMRVVNMAHGSLYLLGGRNASGAALASVLRIDPTTGKVTRAGRLPRALEDPAAVTLGDAIVVLGGAGSSAVLSLSPKTAAG